MYCERECVCVVGTSAERQAEEAERTDLSTAHMSSIMQKHSKTVLNYSSLHSSHQGLNAINHTYSKSLLSFWYTEQQTWIQYVGWTPRLLVYSFYFVIESVAQR